MKQSCKQNSDSEVTEKCRQTHVRMDIPSQGTQGWRGRMYIHEYEKRRKQTKKQRGRERERTPTTCYLLVKTRQHHMLQPAGESCYFDIFISVKFVPYLSLLGQVDIKDTRTRPALHTQILQVTQRVSFLGSQQRLTTVM